MLIYLHHDHDRRSGCDGAGVATLHNFGNRIRRYHAVCHGDNRRQCGAAANARRPFGNTGSGGLGGNIQFGGHGRSHTNFWLVVEQVRSAQRNAVLRPRFFYFIGIMWPCQ